MTTFQHLSALLHHPLAARAAAGLAALLTGAAWCAWREARG